MGDANGFGCLLATGRFGIVEYEKRNFRGSFQVKKVSPVREVREVWATSCSCVSISRCLHSPSAAVSEFSTSQSFVSQ